MCVTKYMEAKLPIILVYFKISSEGSRFWCLFSDFSSTQKTMSPTGGQRNNDEVEEAGDNSDSEAGDNRRIKTDTD